MIQRKNTGRPHHSTDFSSESATAVEAPASAVDFATIESELLLDEQAQRNRLLKRYRCAAICAGIFSIVFIVISLLLFFLFIICSTNSITHC